MESRKNCQKKKDKKKRVKRTWKNCEQTNDTTTKLYSKNKFCGTIKYKLWKTFSHLEVRPLFRLRFHSLNNIKYDYGDVNWNGEGGIITKLSMAGTQNDVKSVQFGEFEVELSGRGYHNLVVMCTEREREWGRIETTSSGKNKKRQRIIFSLCLTSDYQYIFGKCQ